MSLSASDLIPALHRPKMTPDLQKRIDAEMLRGNSECYKQLLSESSVPIAYWHLVKDGPAPVYARATFQAMLQKTRENPFGILGICGEYRSGKSCLAVRLMDAFMWSGRSAYYLTPTRFITRLFDAGKTGAEVAREQVFDRCRQPAMLVIDDFHNRSDNAWEKLQLHELIESRWASARWTVLVSAGSPKQLCSLLGKSFVARMSETGVIVNCKPATQT